MHQFIMKDAAGGHAAMHSKEESHVVRWRLGHSPDSEFLGLSNLGNGSAVDVRVQFHRGAEPGNYGAVTFDSVAAGVFLRLNRFAPYPGIPPWNEITVTWRQGGWLTRKRLHRWDATAPRNPTTAPRPATRGVPVGSVRVPQQRRRTSQ
jgi:hypothetical protein